MRPQRQESDLYNNTIALIELTSLSASQDIHESGLASTTDPHEAGEYPRAKGSTDAYQQFQHGLAPLLVDMLLALCSFLHHISHITHDFTLFLACA